MQFPSSPAQVGIHFMDKLHSTWVSLIIMDINSNCLLYLHSAQEHTRPEHSKFLWRWLFTPWKNSSQGRKTGKTVTLTHLRKQKWCSWSFFSWGMVLEIARCIKLDMLIIIFSSFYDAVWHPDAPKTVSFNFLKHMLIIPASDRDANNILKYFKI